MGVIRVGRPAQHVEIGVVGGGGDLAEELGLGLRRQVDLDADLGEHGGDGGADRLVVLIAVVRAVHAEGEAVGVAGLGHQGLGLFQVELRALVLGGVVAVHAGAEHEPGDVRLAAHDPGGDGVLVDRQREGLADSGVLERVLALDRGGGQLVAPLVHAEEDGAQLRADDQVEALGGLDARLVLRRDGVDHVHVARQQGGDAGGGVGDDAEFDAGEVVLGLVPPVGVRLQDGAAVRLAQHQLERAGAHGVADGVVLVLGGEVDRLGGVVLLAPGLAHDGPGGDLLREDRIDLVGLELHRQVVDLAHLLHRGEHGAHDRGGGADAAGGEHHVIGGEGGAVLPFDVGAQGEAPDRGAGLLPFGGERGFQGQVAVAADQRLVDVGVEGELEGLVAGVGVHGVDVAVVGPFEHGGGPGVGEGER